MDLAIRSTPWTCLSVAAPISVDVAISSISYSTADGRPPLLVTSQATGAVGNSPVRFSQFSWGLSSIAEIRFPGCCRISDSERVIEKATTLSLPCPALPYPRLITLPFRFQAVDLIRPNWRRCAFFPFHNCFFASDQAEFEWISVACAGVIFIRSAYESRSTNSSWPTVCLSQRISLGADGSGRIWSSSKTVELEKKNPTFPASRPK